MQWSPQQDIALRAVSAWQQAPHDQVFYLAGYAGTGKTTLAQHFAQGVGGRVRFAAYTGKAAHVMRQKGCLGASTIHSLIYLPKDKSRERLRQLERKLVALLTSLRAADPDIRGEDEAQAVQELEADILEERRLLAQPAFTLNPESELQDAALLIVDECSMVDSDLGEDILSFGAPVLVLGDPAQLPPVRGGGFFTERKPDVMLTEIHRQARDNPIIAMATDVREGRGLGLGKYGTSSVIHRSNLPPEHPALVDQVLVGMNHTRHEQNRCIRKLLNMGEDWMPIPQDKVVCLRNDHDLGLLNGSLWTITDIGSASDRKIVMQVRTLDGLGDGQPLEVTAWGHHFRGEEDELDWGQRKQAAEFAFGYALTVHKAQGSQWDQVLLFDESSVFRNEHARWLYTGITRAAESVVVVRGK